MSWEVEKLAGEYGIGIYRSFGKVDAPSAYSVEPSRKLGAAIIEAGFTLVGNDTLKEEGLGEMPRPFVFDHHAAVLEEAAKE